jgi:HEPN domain-containing protein
MSVPAEVRLAEAERWLTYAAEDLHAAESALCEAHLAPRHRCTFAQQAAEKALKAALVSLGIDPPRTHNLQLLADLLPVQWGVSSLEVDFASLSMWAVESRYPGDWPESTDTDAEAAVSAARAVLDAIVGNVRNAQNYLL